MTRNESELVAAAREVGYELQQYALSAWELRSGRCTASTPVRNALVESFLVHVRNMALFLLGEEKDYRTDDIATSDFTPDHLWQPAPEASVARLKQARLAAHKHLAHLTWTRVSAPHAGDALWKDEFERRDVMTVYAEWLLHVEQYNPGEPARVLRLVRDDAWSRLNAPI